MIKISKYSDINAVINKADECLANIEREYQKYLNEERVPESLLVEIKDCLGNLRSSLDYLWNRIRGVNDEKFPITNSAADFAKKTLGLNLKYINVLSKWQPYNNQEWIQSFSTLNNKHKHLTLIPQKRQETREFSIKKDGAGITARGCTFRGNISFGVGGVSVPIDETSQFPVDIPGVDVRRIIWVDFLFDGDSISPDFPKEISVLPFLKLCCANVKVIIFEMEQVI